ncbi:MAG: hypothetical protein SFV51_08890 [Bryobacteraceae bacterium]|nr:hypothetical protein [Bryobacteraceae bacterium]
MTRRCGWIRQDPAGPERAVWARGGMVLTSCPKSYISGNSEAWIEEHRTRSLLGGAPIEQLEARTVHALMLLEAESRKEESNGGRS